MAKPVYGKIPMLLETAREYWAEGTVRLAEAWLSSEWSCWQSTFSCTSVIDRGPLALGKPMIRGLRHCSPLKSAMARCYLNRRGSTPPAVRLHLPHLSGIQEPQQILQDVVLGGKIRVRRFLIYSFDNSNRPYQQRWRLDNWRGPKTV